MRKHRWKSRSRCPLSVLSARVGDRLFLGLGLRYLDIEKGTEGLSGFTADAGLLLSVSKEFHLGLIGKNLFKIDDPLVSRKVGGGIALTGQSLTLTSDVLVDLDRHEEGAKPIFAVGLESLAGGTVPLRIGYTNDQVTEHHLLGGGVDSSCKMAVATVSP